MTTTGRTANTKRLVFLVWLLVASFYFYLSYDYIRVTMSDKQFEDYLHYVVQLAGNEGRPNKDIRNLLLVRAEQLSLPLHVEQITVRGGGNSLDVAVNYDVDIEIPLLEHEIYKKTFQHQVRYQGPR